ncbi:MAG: molybdopterin-dependent oxidoreductase [Gracilibacteraceae bacterium]|jgi:anaerobic selenocysteine-containing dehydrogenase/Fe-S-cluster-containing dehydrogenase component|nr:molybdopterin-dependent oxidoreductase [Gracilibacteraceae bacterium]
MARYGMLIDLERCTACYSCVNLCKQYFGTRPGVDYNQGRMVEWGEYPQAHRRYLSTMCNHCEEPPCLKACPHGATYKAAEGPVLTWPDRCTGCGVCVTACPYGQRFMTTADETYFPGHPLPAESAAAVRLYKAEKCTLCQERLAQNLEPICVALCPGGCRIFGDLEDAESEINYYIRLYGAVKIEGTSLYYVLPEGMDPALLPMGYDPASGRLTPTTLAGAEKRRTRTDPDYQSLMDGLIAARDKFRDRLRRNDDRPPDVGGEYRYSYCAMCNHGPKCGVKAVVQEGKVLRLERREEYGNELLCAIGASAVQDLYAPDRLLYPLRRTNPKGEPSEWRRISWDEALSEMAARLNGIKEQYGADKVLFLTGDPKEPRSVLQRLAYSFGTPHFGTESSTCYTAAELGIRLIYGARSKEVLSLTMGGMVDISDTKVCLIWGCNPGTAAPFSYDKMRTAREFGAARYIVIDPRVTATSENFADVHLQIRPGTDGALALFFADYLIRRGAYDREFIAQWAHGFDEYRALAAEYDLARTAAICQVPEDLLRRAGDILAGAGGPIAIRTSAAYPQHVNGVDNYRAIHLLAPLTGSLDVEGGHLIANEPLDFDGWGGSYAFSRAHELLPELGKKRIDRKYFPVWADTDWDGSLQVNRLPEYVRDGELRACFALGLNCIMWPQSHEYQAAFKNMDFVAVADFRENPWTHDYVDMLLPAAMSFERSAPFSLVGRRVFLREPIVEPAGEARSDYRIVCDLGTALGMGDLFWGGGPGAEEQCLREILRTAGGGRRLTLEELRAAAPDGLTIPLQKGPQYKKWELGLLRPDGQPGFPTPSGKVEFASEILRAHGFDPLPRYREPSYSPLATPDVAAQYPLIMNAGSRVPFFCHSKERRLPWLRRFMPDPLVRLSPGDAAVRGLRDGEWVRITSPVNPRGIMAKLEVSNILKPGVIDMFHGWAEADVNELIPRDFDPISGFPPYKEGLCEISRA